MKTKKSPSAKWKKITAEIFRYFFFTGYVLLLAGILYGAGFFFKPSPSASITGEKP